MITASSTDAVVVLLRCAAMEPVTVSTSNARIAVTETEFRGTLITNNAKVVVSRCTALGDINITTSNANVAASFVNSVQGTCHSHGGFILNEAKASGPMVKIRTNNGNVHLS